MNSFGCFESRHALKMWTIKSRRVKTFDAGIHPRDIKEFKGIFGRASSANGARFVYHICRIPHRSARERYLEPARRAAPVPVRNHPRLKILSTTRTSG